jgi:predicted RNase H-like HicB family nuclease
MAGGRQEVSAQARYPANIFYSQEDEGYIATAPDLPGCSAFGETQEEAFAELQDAIAAWIAAAHAAGNPIPEPSSLKPPPKPSGKILIRIARELHAQLIEGAKRQGTSLNQHIAYLLAVASTCDALGVNTVRSTAHMVALYASSTPTGAVLQLRTRMATKQSSGYPTNFALAVLDKSSTALDLSVKSPRKAWFAGGDSYEVIGRLALQPSERSNG